MEIWLFPIIFMIHDFEEIVMIKIWQKKNKQYIESRKNKYIPFNFKGSTAAFSIAVDIEFIIISIICIVSYLFNSYFVWFGLFTAVTVHLLIHLLMCIDFRRYVPGAITSIIFIPLCCFIIYNVGSSLNCNIVILLLSVLVGFIILLGLIYVLHKIIIKFNNLLEIYSNKHI